MGEEEIMNFVSDKLLFELSDTRLELRDFIAFSTARLEYWVHTASCRSIGIYTRIGDISPKRFIIE